MKYLEQNEQSFCKESGILVNTRELGARSPDTILGMKRFLT